jgi:hypothetical protein
MKTIVAGNIIRRIGFGNTFKIFLTNWINLTLVLIATVETLFIDSAAVLQYQFLDAVVWSVYLALLYGMKYWIVFIGGLFIFDVALFSLDKKPKPIIFKLAIEWILISLPFIYKAFKCDEWMLLCSLVGFAVGQYVRHDYIKKLVETSNGRAIRDNV